MTSGKFALFKFVTKAALSCAGLGLAGDLFGEALPEVAKCVYDWWVKDRKPREIRDDLQAIAAVGDAEAKQLAADAVAAEASGQSPDIQLALVSYLEQLPASVRQTQRRPNDPSGRTVAANLTLRAPADVLALLPARLPRFAKGQRAPGFGDWVLDELLGVGGFGEVWKATNPHLPPVALKFCLDPMAARSLRNEADLLGRVISQGRHPGLVALLNTSLCSEPPCLMYEYVPGGDLGGLVQQWLAMPGMDRVRASLAVMRALADALAFAHRLVPPIVHRDLKPANVLACGAEVKIADFGIGDLVAAQAAGSRSVSARTLPTALRGSCTPLYASPQQMRSAAADPRDDVFSLGVIWYQMLTGDLTERPGTDWREELAAVPADVLDVLGRCLAVRAERRIADGRVLADELAAIEDLQASVDADEIDALDESDDDPLCVAGKLQRSLASAQRTLARAVDLCEKRHDYGAAVRLLERMPEAFRDDALLDVVRARRDRVAELRKTITQSARALRFAGLRDRIEELLTLQPEDAETRRLLDVVPWQPGPEVVNAAGMKLLLIPLGACRIGSPLGEAGRSPDEGPTRVVKFKRLFYLGAHPVTQGQYGRVMGDNPSHFRNVPGIDARTLPVECVSWRDANAFCAALSALPDEKRRGRRYRLPTEAEWEYACRAGTDAPFGVEPGVSLSSAQANFDGRRPYGFAPRGEFLERTSPVGAYAPNRFGLFDLHGNVWEWCADLYYESGSRQGSDAPTELGQRVLRGGSWQNHARLCRAACRDRAGERYRSLNAGFRVVLEVDS